MSAPRVLVLDDEADLRELLEITLLKMGMDVDSAATLRDCPRQSTTSTTGAPSSPATCAVDPCPSASRPSKSPMTP